MNPSDIPRRIERMALSDAFVGLMQLYVAGLKKAGVDPVYMRVIAAVYTAAWRGRRITVSSLSEIYGLPKETTRRHLAALVRKRIVEQNGTHYYMGTKLLMHPPGDIDAAIKVVLDAADILRHTRKGNI